MRRSSLNDIMKRYFTFESRCRLLGGMQKSYETSRLAFLTDGDPETMKSIFMVLDVEAIRVATDHVEQSAFIRWSNEQLRESLKVCELCTKADGTMLVKVSILFGTRFLYNE